MKKVLTISILTIISISFSFAQTEANKVDNSNKKSISQANNTNVTSYNFTDSANKYYGGANGATEIEAGVWGMIAGDANGDGGVYSEDYSAYKNNQGAEGYESADYNMDGGVYSEDYAIYKLNQGKETQVPQ